MRRSRAGIITRPMLILGLPCRPTDARFDPGTDWVRPYPSLRAPADRPPPDFPEIPKPQPPETPFPAHPEPSPGEKPVPRPPNPKT